MHIHILGICGTFMGGLAILAQQMGHRVSGADANVYPPMSTQLAEVGIELTEGWDPAQLEPAPDLVVIGNALSRGNPAVEYVLERGLRYTSGPQLLSEQLLWRRWVLAVAGTHGKTSTSSMLAWILEHAGFEPGFLIGGVPRNFGISARYTESPFFVIEADEYDSAFFDKRSKFVHYHPRTLILNNLEFDHADIFADLASIQRQFHHLLRVVPATGQVLLPADDANLRQVLEAGCWSETRTLAVGEGSGDWQARPLNDACSAFEVRYRDGETLVAAGTLQWEQLGEHNMRNALAALAAARHVGVRPEQGIEALTRFAGSRRRLELLGTPGGVAIYDDFAHHPTAIATTLAGLRAKVGTGQRIIAVIEPRSNTMRMGVHRRHLAPATADADRVLWYQPPGMDWDLAAEIAQSPVPAALYGSVEEILQTLCTETRAGDHIVIMSNGGFGGIHGQLLARLAAAE